MSKYLKGFAGEQVSARLTRETEKKDFLYYILRAKNSRWDPGKIVSNGSRIRSGRIDHRR
jgi:hypothetical protein